MSTADKKVGQTAACSVVLTVEYGAASMAAKLVAKSVTCLAALTVMEEAVSRDAH